MMYHRIGRPDSILFLVIIRVWVELFVSVSIVVVILVLLLLVGPCCHFVDLLGRHLSFVDLSSYFGNTRHTSFIILNKLSRQYSI